MADIEDFISQYKEGSVLNTNWRYIERANQTRGNIGITETYENK